MHYSISDLEQLSGIQIHTIRVWEQRYNALQPIRSAGNTRLYDDDQLKKLLNIASLNKSGLRISQICALSDQEIKDLIQKDIQNTVSKNENYENYISQLLKSGLEYDDDTFDKIISKFIKLYGITICYKEIIYPLLVRLGLMWRKDSICPAQEHFLSNNIRQKIFAAIDNLPASVPGSPTWILFLPENEEHDIGLLFAKYLLKKARQKVLYLGSKVSLTSLKEVMEVVHAEHVMLFMIQPRLSSDVQQYINELSIQMSDTQIHLAGNSKLMTDLHLPVNVSWFNSLEQFEESIQFTKNTA